jgi:leader peptidase (prepilin peptidase)/N-methyltransferase
MALDLGPPWLLPLVAAPAVGSFLGLLVLRLPAGGTIALGRSACVSCGRRLAAIDLIPLVSWAALRGRCRHCGRALGWFYPGIEAGALAIAAWAALALPAGLVWTGCLLGWWLAALAAIDARTLHLPDILTLPLIPAGLAATWLLAPGEAIHHAAGAAAGYGALAAIGLAYRRARGRDGIGGGDAKLAAAAGAWVGWTGLPGVILLAALSGLALGLPAALKGRALDPAKAIPFGPHLALGTWVTWVHGPLLFD